MDDVRAVMDAVGSERAALFGISEGGPMSILFAATYPERTHALVMYGTYAKRAWSVDHPYGWKSERWDKFFHNVENYWWGIIAYRHKNNEADYVKRPADTTPQAYHSAFVGCIDDCIN